jgi:hypothetical protein
MDASASCMAALERSRVVAMVVEVFLCVACVVFFLMCVVDQIYFGIF